MRKVTLLIASVALMSLLVASAAFAVTKIGTNGPNNLRGTQQEDVIYGLSGGDDLAGLGSEDELYAGRGNDEVRAASGNDYVSAGKGQDFVFGSFGNDDIEAFDHNKDFIDCGPGTDDEVTADDEDEVSANCENVVTL
jgi:Ca2+-binding RTX toxin-like protein